MGCPPLVYALWWAATAYLWQPCSLLHVGLSPPPCPSWAGPGCHPSFTNHTIHSVSKTGTGRVSLAGEARTLESSVSRRPAPSPSRPQCGVWSWAVLGKTSSAPLVLVPPELKNPFHDDYFEGIKWLPHNIPPHLLCRHCDFRSGAENRRWES